MTPPSAEAPRPGPRAVRGRRAPALAAAAALALVVLALYAPALRFESLGYDDAPHVYQNPRVRGGLTPDAVRWAFGSAHLGNWVPVTWLSHMLDFTLWGADPGMHHGVNAVLHATTAGLLLLALRALTGSLPGAAAAAALFALHPLRVESVAWISERKDMLMGLFGALTLLAYARHARRPSSGRLMAVAGLFALGLMAKPLLAPLPLLLLVLDWWPLGRLGGPHPLAPRGSLPRLGPLVREKVPLLLLALPAGVVSFAAQAPIMPGPERLPAIHRAMNAAVSIPWYLVKTVWPSGLAVLYPHRMRDQPVLLAAAGLLLVAAISALALRTRRRLPWLAAGWAWYLAALLPTLGFPQAGMQARADRYSYLPHLGAALAAVWSAAALVRRFPRARPALVAATASALVALTLCSARQLRVWRDENAVFTHALAVTGRNAVAHNQLGAVAFREKRFADAEREFRAALAIAPKGYQPLVNLGMVMQATGRHAEALPLLRAALEQEPGQPLAQRQLGLLLAMEGRLEEAIRLLRASLEREPGNVRALQNLGAALVEAGRNEEAVAAYREALRIDPGNPAAAAGLRRALAARAP